MTKAFVNGRLVVSSSSPSLVSFEKIAGIKDRYTVKGFPLLCKWSPVVIHAGLYLSFIRGHVKMWRKELIFNSALILRALSKTCLNPCRHFCGQGTPFEQRVLRRLSVGSSDSDGWATSSLSVLLRWRASLSASLLMFWDSASVKRRRQSRRIIWRSRG
jgi:hypothetical protein